MARGGPWLLRRLRLLLVTHTVLRTLAPWEAGGRGAAQGADLALDTRGVLGAWWFLAAGLAAPRAQGLVNALAGISGVAWGRALRPG